MNKKDKLKKKIVVRTWFSIPEEVTYDNLINQLHNWLANRGREKLYSIAQNIESPQISFQTNWMYEQNANVITQINDYKNTKSICISEIESIIKLLNKHKALLEASNGIE